MNVLNVTRALRAINSKVELLQERRTKAKDKPRWDVKNGDELASAVQFQKRLGRLLLRTLTDQGQFDHAGGEVPAHPDGDYDGR